MEKGNSIAHSRGQNRYHGVEYVPDNHVLLAVCGHVVDVLQANIPGIVCCQVDPSSIQVCVEIPDQMVLTITSNGRSPAEETLFVFI